MSISLAAWYRGADDAAAAGGCHPAHSTDGRMIARLDQTADQKDKNRQQQGAGKRKQHFALADTKAEVSRQPSEAEFLQPRLQCGEDDEGDEERDDESHRGAYSVCARSPRANPSSGSLVPRPTASTLNSSPISASES